MNALTLRAPEYDRMLTNAGIDDLIRMVDGDPNASERERALADAAERLTDMDAQIEAAQEAQGAAETKAEGLEEELKAAHEAGDVFRALLRAALDTLDDTSDFYAEIEEALREHPSETEKSAAKAAHEEQQRLWRIRSAHGASAASLMGKPAAFEYREHRKRTWQRAMVTQDLSEDDLREMEKYRMRRGKEVSEARWVSP